jgi:ribonuclease P protein component
MPGFVLLVRPREDGDPAIGLGITVTKKIGGAVVRNRMKRRFRALAREVLPDAGVRGADHVLIGREGGIERDYGLLRGDFLKALSRLTKAGLPEPVEGSPFFSDRSKENQNRPSTSSGKPGLNGRRS